MHTISNVRLLVCAAACALLAAGCGSEIGDSCQFNSDCSPAGDRVCISGFGLPGGYCTVVGCNYDTCPEESVCVRFFSLGSTNIPCDPATEDATTDACTVDEFCSLGGSCMPLSAESRYCMRTCGGDGDCRDDYQCRTRDLMITYGGEPVLPPGENPGDDVQAFCAAAPLPEAETSTP